MSNRKQQNPTKAEAKREVSTTTGLTPIQEQAAMLLANGESVTAVANKLSINRSTIYDWQKQVTYRCFFNRQCADNRSTLAIGLFSLAQEALTAVRECLHSDNEQTRLKAAIWLTERLDNFSIGATDVKEALKKECTHPVIDWGMDENVFDESEYKQRLKALGLDDE